MKRWLPILAFLSMSALLSSPALAAANGDQAVGMGLLAWLIVGLIAGFLASKVVNRRGKGFLLDIVLGIVGAWIGGLIFRSLGAAGVTGFNLWSILVAFVGAVVLLVAYHAVAGRGAGAA
jgi:uncharacterized membrane protein YeaQ/YmgE (transglycosylase-associated protein family)